jgi:hypothetical protein
MSLSAARNIVRRAVARIAVVVKSGTTIYAGALVTLLTADGTAVPAGTASAGVAVGVARATVTGDGIATVDVEPGCFRFNNSGSTDQITAADIGNTCYIVDDSTVAKTDNSAARKAAGVIADVDDVGVWVVDGRSEHARLRGLVYYFAGCRQIAWRPTFAQDFVPVAAMTAASTTIDIAYVGYTRFAQRRASKRDIRIEHNKGAPLYRHITDSTEVDAHTERLSLDSALGLDLAVADVKRISYLELVRQNSDDVELQHDNAPNGDAGSTSLNTVFRALRDDLELPA